MESTLPEDINRLIPELQCVADEMADRMKNKMAMGMSKEEAISSTIDEALEQMLAITRQANESRKLFAKRILNLQESR